MMNQSIKIIFILSSLQDTHAIKRICEFQEQNYQYEVYGFSRDIGKKPDIPHTELGKIINGSSYSKRINIVFSAMRVLAKKYRKQNCLFYCFGFEIALSALLFRCGPYIYESCDLTYTYSKNRFLISIFKTIDRFLVRFSFLTVLTSEGFAKFLFKKIPQNVSFITNRLNQSVLSLIDANIPVKKFQKEKIVICFTGGLRFHSLISFAETIASQFPAITLNFHGRVAKFDQIWTARLQKLKESSNVHFYNEFKNPDDLPGIYESADFILCTYDTEVINVRYAEPNKFYESIYFCRPIIVSDNTFLAEKVKRFGIGFSVNPADPASIRNALTALTEENVEKMQKAAQKIPKIDCINANSSFFALLREKMECLTIQKTIKFGIS